MNRRRLPYLSALSLVLCLISMLGWRLARDTPAQAAFVRGSRLWIVSIGSGVGRVESFDGWPSDAPRQTNGVFLAPNWRGLRAFRSRGVNTMSGQARVGFLGEAALRPWGGRYWQFAIEFWLPTLLFAILPVLYFVRSMVLSRRTQRRADMGLCHRCGYDLRATPGRCPECGAVPETEEA